MKATGIMVGNWTHSDGSVFQMQPHLFLTIEESCTEPIPLTEDWLDRFGFEKKIKDWGEIFVHEDYCFLIIRKNNEWYRSNDSGYSEFDKGFNHVHELQNKYFWATGEELILLK